MTKILFITEGRYVKLFNKFKVNPSNFVENYEDSYFFNTPITEFILSLVEYLSRCTGSLQFSLFNYNGFTVRNYYIYEFEIIYD